MMDTQQTVETVSPQRTNRVHQAWFLVSQLTVLGIMILALAWSTAPPTPYQAMLGLCAAVSLVLALVANWRRSEATAVTGGIALAMTCALSFDHTWTASFLASTYIPLVTPIIVGVTLFLLVSGGIIRVGAFGQSSFGKGALISAFLIMLLAVLYYRLINYAPAFRLDVLNYAMYPDQLQEILAVALLYPLAIWLGGTGIRQANRFEILPAGTVLVFVTFLVLWHVR
ncbi:MAG TPA: hypothetical protein VHV83_03970 [Armatimonadota bacterium]|nr:hypothetical protein [Armatimonadota bacterium]